MFFDHLTCVMAFLLLHVSYDFVQATDDRIVGGRPAHVGEIPYQVSLRKSYNDKHFCGGVLVTSKHVLTAAHCMYYIWGGILPPIVVSAVVGQLDLPITEKSVYRNASSILIHPKFTRKTMADDVAVIELDKELPIGKNPLINTVSLRKDRMRKGNCFVSGWGVEEYNSTVVSKELLLAEVQIVDFERCKTMYTENVTLSDGMMCAGHVNGTTDACQGDSGGPLVCDGFLTGIVSTGSGCGSAEYPGIYAEVSRYYQWIKEVTNLDYIHENRTQLLQTDEQNDFLTNKDVYYIINNSGFSMKNNLFVFISIVSMVIFLNNR